MYRGQSIRKRRTVPSYERSHVDRGGPSFGTKDEIKFINTLAAKSDFALQNYATSFTHRSKWGSIDRAAVLEHLEKVLIFRNISVNLQS